ncbi:glycosyltransferase family 4 protein [Parabacteroides distasonis]|uniref:glycosyltransferase family 4 protein n=1 Tax=Parabacteroides distasonis TaxID=823 RepID=UPI00232E2E00|nr:glycosyltransferase family 4 protein [Parabacteroides distasonis]MDB9029813.1 glycosyltransferase family 4 protein [Parabacteroides distasonis]MDB9075615.1 glycosyltransferase family 4 protein [Parabacteroides distasonis]
MHLLYIHQYFKFPDASDGTRSYDLAKSFVEKGMKVSIITSNLSTNYHSKDKWKRIEKEGLIIYSIDCPYNNNMSFYQRIKAFLSFLYSASLKSLTIENVDVVLATSTPLTVAVPALVKKLFQRIPYVFEVRDVWPEVPIKMGFVKNPLLIKFLRYFEKLVYAKALAVVPLSVGMFQNITSRIKGLEDKMFIIPNISELDRFADFSKKIDFPFNVEGKKILIYCGTLGTVNGLSYLVELAAKTIAIDRDVVYCIVGKGKELEPVLALAEERGVLNKNFFYMGVVAKDELSYLYHVATVGSSFVINNPVLWDNSANKFFDTLAAHRPVVINHEGWQADVIREYKCGFVLSERITDDLALDFVRFMNDKEQLVAAGENAYQLAVDNYSLPIAVANYMRIFGKLDLNKKSCTNISQKPD